MTEGDRTTLDNLTGMGEGQRRGQPCLTGAALGARQLISCSSRIGRLDQSLPEAGKAKGNGSRCREMTNRQEEGTWPSHACAGVDGTPVDGLRQCSEEERLNVDQRL